MMMLFLVLLLFQMTCSFCYSIPEEEIDPDQDLAPTFMDSYSRRLDLVRDWMEEHELNVQPYRYEVRLTAFWNVLMF